MSESQTAAWAGLAAVVVMTAAIFLAAEYLSIVDRPIRVAKVCAPNGECADVARYSPDGGDAIGRWLHRDDLNMVASGFYFGFWGRFPRADIVVGGHDCADNQCTVPVLYDQSGHGNNLYSSSELPSLIKKDSFWAVGSAELSMTERVLQTPR